MSNDGSDSDGEGGVRSRQVRHRSPVVVVESKHSDGAAADAANGFHKADYTDLTQREALQLARERREVYERRWRQWREDKNSVTTLNLLYVYADMYARNAVRALGWLLRTVLVMIATPLWLPRWCLNYKDRGAPGLEEMEGGRRRRKGWKRWFEGWYYAYFTRIVVVVPSIVLALAVAYVLSIVFAGQIPQPTRDDVVRGKASARHVDDSFTFLDDRERMDLMRERCEPVTAEEMKSGLFAKGWRIADVEDAMHNALTVKYAASSAGGLSAVHVRVNKCLVVMREEATRAADGTSHQRVVTLINPVIRVASDETVVTAETEMLCGDDHARAVERPTQVLVEATQWTRDDVCTDEDCIFTDRLRTRHQFDGSAAGILAHLVRQTRGDSICNEAYAV